MTRDDYKEVNPVSDAERGSNNLQRAHNQDRGFREVTLETFISLSERRNHWKGIRRQKEYVIRWGKSDALFQRQCIEQVALALATAGSWLPQSPALVATGRQGSSHSCSAARPGSFLHSNATTHRKEILYPCHKATQGRGYYSNYRSFSDLYFASYNLFW